MVYIHKEKIQNLYVRKDRNVSAIYEVHCKLFMQPGTNSLQSTSYLYFYISAHSDFGFFSFVGYLHPKDYIKSVKNPFLNLEVNNLYHALVFLMLKGII